MSRLALHAGARAGTVTLLKDYAQSLGLKLQVYRTRPAQLKTPSAFIEDATEDAADFSRDESQRTVRVRIRLVWGVFDYGDAVDQRDRFLDGFYGHVMDNPHAFGANTTCSWVAVADDPDYSVPWIKGDGQDYYSSVLTLEGFAST